MRHTHNSHSWTLSPVKIPSVFNLSNDHVQPIPSTKTNIRFATPNLNSNKTSPSEKSKLIPFNPLLVKRKIHLYRLV